MQPLRSRSTAVVCSDLRTQAEHDTRKNVMAFGSPIRELLPAGYVKLSGVALDAERILILNATIMLRPRHSFREHAPGGRGA